jgi:ribonuclease HI
MTAISGPLYNYRESIPMGSLSTVFSAEAMAILRCTELLLTKNFMRTRIHICSDSRAALAALVKTTAESSIVWECTQVLGKLNKLYKVTLVWIPRYQGALDNEETDRLATEGATEVPPNQFTAIPFRVGEKTNQEPIGTEASGQVDCLYWLPAVQHADEIPSV